MKLTKQVNGTGADITANTAFALSEEKFRQGINLYMARNAFSNASSGDFAGAIDIGGMKRFGPQSSANLRLVQNVFSFSNDLTHVRGRHTLKAGALVERYQDNMVNPTFSLGIFTFGLLWPGAALSPLVALAYFTLTLGGRHSATPGMRWQDIELRTWNGRRPGYLQAALQTILFYVTVSVAALVLVVPFFTARRRCLHDYLCGTVFVRRSV